MLSRMLLLKAHLLWCKPDMLCPNQHGNKTNEHCAIPVSSLYGLYCRCSFLIKGL
jgi:hypothetical protein